MRLGLNILDTISDSQGSGFPLRLVRTSHPLLLRSRCCVTGTPADLRLLLWWQKELAICCQPVGSFPPSTIPDSVQKCTVTASITQLLEAPAHWLVSTLAALLQCFGSVVECLGTRPWWHSQRQTMIGTIFCFDRSRHNSFLALNFQGKITRPESPPKKFQEKYLCS